MSPLGDAVSLIHSYQLDVFRTLRVHSTQLLPEAAAMQGGKRKQQRQYCYVSNCSAG
jgi:hypothetical protein